MILHQLDCAFDRTSVSRNHDLRRIIVIGDCADFPIGGRTARAHRPTPAADIDSALVSTSAPATIAVVGTSYVGLSLAMLLARHNPVRAHDIDAHKIGMLREGRSPISDPDIERFLRDEKLDIAYTTSPEEAYAGAEFVIIATPTNYDEVTNYFDTRSVESVIRDVARINPDAVMVIKSTIPVGFTNSVRARLGKGGVEGRGAGVPGGNRFGL